LNVAGIGRTGWTWIGPGNVGGRTRAVVVHPNRLTLFAGTVGGGIWKSVDAGGNWAPIQDFLPSLAVSTIVMQPGNPAIMYTGTGEGFFNGDAIKGAGIFKSIDGGTTWTQLPATANGNFDFVNRLAFSADGSILLAGTSTGLFRSVDGGAIWTKVLTPSSNGTIADVKFLPGSSVAAVASGYNGQVFSSQNGGVNWAPAVTGLSAALGFFLRVEVAVSPSVPNNVYAVLDRTGGELYKSVDGGVNFTFVSTPGHLGGQGWYDNVIWIDPTNDQHIVVGGVGLRRSTNGGASFAQIAAGIHSDHHAIVADPAYDGVTNRRVYFGNDGGVYKMEDVTTNSATSLNNNLGVTQFYGAAGHAGTGRVTGGTQDNGTLFYTVAGGPQQWRFAVGGDGGFSAYDPTDANTFYGEFQNFQLHRSSINPTSGAISAQTIYGATGTSCKLPPFVITDACRGGSPLANFIAPFILDPNAPQTLLAGGASLWRTTDAKAPNTSATGPQWTAIKPPVIVNTSPTFISAIAVAQGNSNVIWVGHNNGDVYVTTNGTAAAPGWTKVDALTMPNRMVTRLAIDPANPNIVFATFGSYSSDNLWKTTNGGLNWADSTGVGASGLPDAPIRSVVFHPALSSWIYVGTEVGIFASTDGGATWGLPHDGPANVSVDELFWMGGTLVAATHGRGLFRTTTAVALQSEIVMDTPFPGTYRQSFLVQGWALNGSATSGTGVDSVHVWAFPTNGSAATFLGVASYGAARPDVGNVFGAQFTNSGYALGASGLAFGDYTIVAYAHNAATGVFDASVGRSITVAPPQSAPAGNIDLPAQDSVVGGNFTVAGWAIDTAAESGTGIDAIHAYVINLDTFAGPTFVGVGAYGGARGDVGSIFGSRFTNSGYSLTVSGLAPGRYNLIIFARSTVSGTFHSRTRQFSVRPPGNPLMTIDTPTAGSTVTRPFLLAGWAIDLDATANAGVDAVHVWAYPVAGGSPVFVGVGNLNFARPDVAAIFGPQFVNCGYNVAIQPRGDMPPGQYQLVVYAHSAVTGTFNQVRAVTVTIQ
jgi:photosystem II stability/assembly factor-like uncharacterized protein